MWRGKIVGGIIGYLLAGPIGALLGGFFGHLIDTLRQHPIFITFRQAHSSIQKMRKAFFDSTFLVMGHIAKSDGRVTEEALNASRNIMQRMNLTEAQQYQAMRLFTEGKKPEFDLEGTLTRLIELCQNNRILLQMFADIQMQAVNMSGADSPEKQKILNHIFQRFGHSASQSHSGYYRQHQQQSFYTEPPQQKTAQAYRILGIPETATEAEVKRAYRRLMSQHHPDKLVAKGLPEEMMKLATEKAQSIQQAYDVIRAARGFKTKL